jgi:hypothetical protein
LFILQGTLKHGVLRKARVVSRVLNPVFHGQLSHSIIEARVEEGLTLDFLEEGVRFRDSQMIFLSVGETGIQDLLKVLYMHSYSKE